MARRSINFSPAQEKGIRIYQAHLLVSLDRNVSFNETVAILLDGALYEVLANTQTTYNSILKE